MWQRVYCNDLHMAFPIKHKRKRKLTSMQRLGKQLYCFGSYLFKFPATEISSLGVERTAIMDSAPPHAKQQQT